MKQTGTFIILLAVIVALIGLSGYLLNEQNNFQTELEAKETAVAEAQATLVQVFSEQRAQDGASQAELEAQTAEIVALQATQTALEPIAATAMAQTGQPAPPTRTPDPSDRDAPPQVRIILRDRGNVRQVSEPIDVIVSAAHPIGIAAVNITVNGEPLWSESPFDPRMNISTVRWTPEETGEYEITAVATTIRGRTSPPVSINLFVANETSKEALNETILRRIEQQVEELRGWEAQTAVSTAFLTTNELRASIQTDLFADYTPADAERDVRVLSMFDFIEPDYPLYDSLVDTYSQVIAGYYDPKIDTLYVINEDDELDLEEKLTHAHEYMHALQDQYHDISRLGDPELTRDGRLALRALGEGEAELLEFLFQSRGYLTGEQSADSNPVFVTPESTSTPSFLLSDFSFPYVQGYAFVSYFFNDGAFTAVNQLWEAEPVSTEQILHPERYAAGDVPQETTLPDLTTALGSGWALLEDGRFGEFYLREYLQQWLETQDEVDTAATGWGGDQYAVYRHNDGTQLLAYKLKWDTPSDQTEFVTAYTTWADERMGSNNSEAIANGNGRCWSTRNDIICLFEQPNEYALIIRTADLARATAVGQAILEN